MLSVSGVPQNDSAIHILVSVFFQSLFPFRLLQNIEAEFPVLYSRSLLVICSQHHLLKRLFSLNGLGTFIENQLTINRRVYFCTFSFFVCLYVCPYAITTLPWLLLLYSKFWNFDVYILLCSFFRLVIWGLLLFHQYFRISLSASTSWDSTGITPKYFSKYTWYFFF